MNVIFSLKESNLLVKGLFWLFFLTEGISINSAIVVNIIVDYYDLKDKKKKGIFT